MQKPPNVVGPQQFKLGLKSSGEDHSEVYTHQGRKSSNIASKQTQTMPIVELTVSDESSKGLSDSLHHNKENNQKKSPPVGRKRKRTITEHCIKANEPSDVVMLNDRVTTGKTKTLVRCKKCRRKKCKCKPKRKRGLAKGVQLNGLKPGSHLKVQGRQYLVVGAKSYPKQTASMFLKQHFCVGQECEHITCKIRSLQKDTSTVV
uniref:Uncharacterized protein n=1 Tax=Timema monikensis TaxID=170555 RepID=A0A7R9EFV6_9NEOP|nr:unnamed protein product [Timema monikensis]